MSTNVCVIELSIKVCACVYQLVSKSCSEMTENEKSLPSPEVPKYWVQSLDLCWTDESQLLNGEWLTDKHITAANKLLSKQYPSRNGLQDSLVLFENLRWTSDAADFV